VAPHPEPWGLPPDAVRAKLTAAILGLELAREGSGDARARARLDAAARAAWAAADLLDDVPATAAGGRR
jgi:hypothetical protein